MLLKEEIYKELKVWNPYTFPETFINLNDAVNAAVEIALEHGKETTVTLDTIKGQEIIRSNKVIIIRPNKFKKDGSINF